MPVEAATPAADAAPQSVMERDGEAYKTGTVLVVEDEQTNLKLIHRMLQRTSYNIISSRNGQQAVQDYRQHAEIDVVLMDIRMPVMNGDEAAPGLLTRPS